MPALIPALIVGAGAVGAAAINSGAASNATNEAANAASQNTALDSSIYNSNKALIQPAVDRGDAAGDELQGFLGLGGDSAKTSAAFNTYLGSTGYQFDVDQGEDAVNQRAAAEGLYNSGAAEKALDTYATGQAQQYGQAYAGDLASVANTGEQAVNALTGAGTTYAGAVSSANNSAATVAANAGIAAAASDTSLINSAINAFGATRGASSFGSGATSTNAFNGG